MAGKADLLGKYEIYLGSYRKLFSAGDDLERVSAADVQRVAKAYLAARNRTVAILLPEDGEASRELSE
jgi:zinc protease